MAPAKLYLTLAIICAIKLTLQKTQIHVQKCESTLAEQSGKARCQNILLTIRPLCPLMIWMSIAAALALKPPPLDKQQDHDTLIKQSQPLALHCAAMLTRYKLMLCYFQKSGTVQICYLC